MRRVVVLLVVLTSAAVVGSWAFQVAARDRQYRALLSQGDSALRDDQTFGAIEAYSGAATLRPDSMLARLRRGETYQRRGELEAAAKDFRAASDLDPTATRPLEKLGDALYQLRRFDRAADAFERAFKLDDRSARVAYKLALARYREGKLDRAIAVLTQATRFGDPSADVYYLLGLCYRDMRRRVEAEQAFDKAVRLSPGLIAAREELGDLFGVQGRVNDEIGQLQVIAGLEPEHVERQVELGLAQARIGQAEPAVLTLGGALTRSPDSPLVYAALGRIWLEDAEARSDHLALKKALEALQRVASSSASASSFVLTTYGRALLRDEQVERAEQVLLQATKTFPLEPAAFLFYADVAERQERFEAARQALIDYSALAGEDDQWSTRTTRIAALSIKLGDIASAVRWLKRAAAATPEDARVMALLADAQLRAGDRESAAEAIQRGLALDPESPPLLALARRAKTSATAGALDPPAPAGRPREN